jgi:hypothetical protein
MDESVEREYERLYREFSDEYELRSSVDQVGEQAQANTGRRLRTDARYLLLINFSEMVIRPADRAQKVSSGELREATRDDILTVVRAAAERARAQEISGHDVINALTTVWGELKTMAYNVWD